MLLFDMHIHHLFLGRGWRGSFLSREDLDINLSPGTSGIAFPSSTEQMQAQHNNLRRAKAAMGAAINTSGISRIFLVSLTTTGIPWALLKHRWRLMGFPSKYDIDIDCLCTNTAICKPQAIPLLLTRAWFTKNTCRVFCAKNQDSEVIPRYTARVVVVTTTDVIKNTININYNISNY